MRNYSATTSSSQGGVTYGGVAEGNLERSLNGPLIYDARLALGSTVGQGAMPPFRLFDTSFSFGMAGYLDGFTFMNELGGGWAPFYGTARDNVYFIDRLRFLFWLSGSVKMDLAGEGRAGTVVGELNGSIGLLFPDLYDLGLEVRYSKLGSPSSTTFIATGTGSLVAVMITWSHWDITAGQ